jgi:hypothetical protein
LGLLVQRLRLNLNYLLALLDLHYLHHLCFLSDLSALHYLLRLLCQLAPLGLHYL